MSTNHNHSEENSFDAFYKNKAKEYHIKPQINAFDAIMAKMATHEPIDDFYKKKASEYRIEPQKTAFESILSKSTIIQKPSLWVNTLKIGGVIVGLSVTAWLLFSKTNQSENTIIEQKQPIIIEEKQHSPTPQFTITEKEKETTKTIVVDEAPILPIENKKIEKSVSPSPSKNSNNSITNIEIVKNNPDEPVKSTENQTPKIDKKEENPESNFDKFFKKRDKKDSTVEIFNEKKKN